MKSILLFLPLLFLACASPQITTAPSKLGIVIDDKQLDVSATLQDEETLVFDKARIKRSRYRLDTDQVVVLEEVRTASLYQFQYDARRSLDIIFGAKAVKQLDRVGNMDFYAITSRDEAGVLYAVAQNLNKKGIRILYGLDPEQMRDAMRHVGSEAYTSADEWGEAVTLPETKTAYKSHWSPKSFIIDGLLIRVGGRLIKTY